MPSEYTALKVAKDSAKREGVDWVVLYAAKTGTYIAVSSSRWKSVYPGVQPEHFVKA